MGLDGYDRDEDKMRGKMAVLGKRLSCEGRRMKDKWRRNCET